MSKKISSKKLFSKKKPVVLISILGIGLITIVASVLLLIKNDNQSVLGFIKQINSKIVSYFSSDKALAQTGWWDDNWQYRGRITVNASANTSAGYTVNFTLDTTGTKFRDDGNDLRIVYWNGTGYEELDRILDPAFSGNFWDSASTRIIFKTKATIAAGASDNNYYVYYGYSKAGAPPVNESNVFAYYNPLESTSGLVQFGSNCQGSLSIASGRLRFQSNSGVIPGCGVYDSNAPSLGDIEILTDIEVANGDSPRTGVIFREQADHQGYAVRIKPSTDDWRIGYTDTNAGWNEFVSASQSSDYNIIYRFRSQMIGSTIRWWFRTLSGSYQATSQSCSDPNWSTGKFGFWNEKSNNGNWYDNLRVRRLVNPEPLVSVAAEEPKPAATTFTVTLTVTDNGTPALQDSESKVLDLSAMTLAGSAIPDCPAASYNLTAVSAMGCNYIAGTWDKLSGYDNAADYIIYRCQGSVAECVISGAWVNITGATGVSASCGIGCSFDDTTVLEDTTYSYYISTTDGKRNSTAAGCDGSIQICPLSDTTPACPSAIGDLTISRHCGYLTVGWAEQIGAVNYRVYKCVDNAADKCLNPTYFNTHSSQPSAISTCNGTTCTLNDNEIISVNIINPSSNSYYCYKVSWQNNLGVWSDLPSTPTCDYSYCYRAPAWQER